MNSDGIVIFIIFNCYLALAVGTEITQASVFAFGSKFSAEFVSERNGEGHVLGCFVASKAEHHSLVAGAKSVNAHCDIT